MAERPRGEETTGSPWRAGWDDQEETAFESSLAATPLQRLEWLEEALELAWASGALSELRDDHASGWATAPRRGGDRR
jgi:hypothetical protein